MKHTAKKGMTYVAPESKYAEVAASCRSIRDRFDVDIREFVILAVIFDAHSANAQALSAVLELSPTTVEYCLSELSENGLAAPRDRFPCEYSATTDGRKLIREAYRGYKSSLQKPQAERVPDAALVDESPLVFRTSGSIESNLAA